MPKVLPDRLEEADGIHAIDLFANQSGVAQLAVRGVAGIAWRHAAGEVVVDLDRQVRVELARPLGVPTSATEEACPGHV